MEMQLFDEEALIIKFNTLMYMAMYVYEYISIFTKP